ncbi:hypothetical protein [Labedaea rhizosphaerae]|uniref:Uncharacterized protein n=1 Tax=Labedaea rhizosphaerae TaxID=598644 RepID=A0A4R6S3F6_LABRH|nr:hypothetical protein [Labedaea rhizosphaerae]TDP93744.1 hypothetical protein EV186_106138 [Labedaea rhizosphaerae]
MADEPDETDEPDQTDQTEEPDEVGGPELRPTLRDWLHAREDTQRHLTTENTQVDAAWVQRLADLLATERSWQDQYTALIALGASDGRFPSSNR